MVIMYVEMVNVLNMKNIRTRCLMLWLKAKRSSFVIIPSKRQLYLAFSNCDLSVCYLLKFTFTSYIRPLWLKQTSKHQNTLGPKFQVQNDDDYLKGKTKIWLRKGFPYSKSSPAKQFCKCLFLAYSDPTKVQKEPTNPFYKKWLFCEKNFFIFGAISKSMLIKST